MGTKFQFDFPPVLDENNEPISVEESESLLQEIVRFVSFTSITNKGPRTFALAINPNNVDDSAMADYDVFKAKRWALFNSRRARVLQGRKLNEPVDENEGPSGEQVIASAKLRPEERRIFMNLLFPQDWEDNPVVLGSNSPDVPTDPQERYQWFKRGGMVATEATEAVVMFLDPTGPLVQEKEAARRAKIQNEEQEKLAQTQFERMQSVLEAKLQEIQGMDVNSLLLATPSRADSTTTSTPVMSDEEALELSHELHLEQEASEDSTANMTLNESSDLLLEEVGATPSLDAPGNPTSETP